MVNYNGLKPGLYVQRGGEIKSLSLTDAAEWRRIFNLGDSRIQGAEQLAASVSWVYAAIQERMDQLREVPVTWQRGETEIEGDGPLRFNPFYEMARIDEAIQLHGAAYYLKQRSSRGIVGLRWLDPTTIEPDEQSARLNDRTGQPEYGSYRRNLSGGVVTMPAEDVIRVWVPRLRELAPGTPASSAASLAGQILYSVNKTLDTFFDTNGLPVTLLFVPAGTSEQAQNRLQDRMRRLFSRGADFDEGGKVAAVSGDIRVERLSLAPNELDFNAISDTYRDAIFAAFRVPAALVYRDVNRAEAEEKREMFAARMLAQAKMYAQAINADYEIERSGLMLEAHPERMEVFQRSELSKAEVVQRVVGRPVLTINEGRALLGYDPVPGGDDIAQGFGLQQQGGDGELTTPEMQEPQSDAKSEELARLRTFLRKGKHERREFRSDVLTPLEIDAEIERHQFAAAFSEALNRFNGALDGS